MSEQRKLKQIEIVLSDVLYQRLLEETRESSQDISLIVEQALERYLTDTDFTDTRTWKLSGSFTIAEPKAPYIVESDNEDEPTTDYASHVDEVLYKKS